MDISTNTGANVVLWVLAAIGALALLALLVLLVGGAAMGGGMMSMMKGCAMIGR